MRIGELGAAAGVDVQTVRYYERAGLLPSPLRADNNYRVYGQTHLERLAFIRHCRALDMTIAEIRRLLELLDQPAAECGDVNRLVDVQLDRVRARMKSLRALEQQLRILRSKCHVPDSAERCGILAELVVTARAEAHASLEDGQSGNGKCRPDWALKL